MPLSARSRPRPVLMAAMTSLSGRTSRRSRAQICASRNFLCSKQLALTSFHVRVELALRAASTTT
eukprot:scaffold10695_cov56-Phaeocystis_antarctica.AAC.1